MLTLIGLILLCILGLVIGGITVIAWPVILVLVILTAIDVIVFKILFKRR